MRDKDRNRYRCRYYMLSNFFIMNGDKMANCNIISADSWILFPQILIRLQSPFKFFIQIIEAWQLNLYKLLIIFEYYESLFVMCKLIEDAFKFIVSFNIAEVVC